MFGFMSGEPGEYRSKSQEARDQDGSGAQRDGERGEDAAEQAGKAEGPDARGAALVGLLPLPPTALLADEQADC